MHRKTAEVLYPSVGVYQDKSDPVGRAKCGGRVLQELDEQAKRLEMMVARLEEAFGPVLRPEGVCDSTKESEPAERMPEFLEHLRQRTHYIESSLDRIESLINRSEL